MNAQQLLLNGFQDFINAGIAVLVPIVIQYILTKVSKTKLEKNAALALSIVKSLQTIGVLDVDIQNLASEKLSALTKGKLKADDINHLIGSAMYEIKKDGIFALNSEQNPSTIHSVPIADDSKAQ